MALQTIGRIALLVDLIGVSIFLVVAWLDLRRQTTDSGRIGGVTVLIALCFIIYWLGRAFLFLGKPA